MPLLRIVAVFAVLLAAAPARAGDLAAFNDAVEGFASHNRLAVEHVRARNAELVNAELARMREAWGDISSRFGGDRPNEFRDNALYVTTMVDVPTRLVGVSLMVTMGRADLVENGLMGIRVALSQMRRASGVEVLADCVLDAADAMEALSAHRDRPADWSESGILDLLGAADAYGAVIRHCKTLAPEALRGRPDFRYLLNSIADQLARLSRVSAARDEGRLREALDELRGLDDLLTLRYG